MRKRSPQSEYRHINDDILALAEELLSTDEIQHTE
jgi:hypothetical protein